MMVGTGGNLGLSREYHKKLFGPLFYTWWNCPLRETTSFSQISRKCCLIVKISTFMPLELRISIIGAFSAMYQLYCDWPCVQNKLLLAMITMLYVNQSVNQNSP